MDKTTSVLAAFEAGKIPSQEQFNKAIDWVLNVALPQAKGAADSVNLSQQGQEIADGLRQVLEAYKVIGTNKNHDDVLARAMFHLASADLEDTTTSVGVDTNALKQDARKVRESLRTLVSVGWSNVSSEGGALFDDFASFMRLALADVAEGIESTAGKAKEGLRDFDDKVQAGERDNVGRRANLSEEEQKEASDPKKVFADTMDTIKDGGVTVIGAGQDAKEKVVKTYDDTTSRLEQAYERICDRAQKDPKYHNAMSTLFNIVEKYINKSLDGISNTDSVAELIDDPTPEQHVPKAIELFRTFLERLAGGESLDGLFAAAKQVILDAREDPDIKKWFQKFFSHVKKSLDQPGFARSEESQAEYKELRAGWKKLVDESNPAGKKFKKDTDQLKAEIKKIQHGLDNDKDLLRLKHAHENLGRAIGDVATEGAQLAIQKASWFWHDLLTVYTPKLFDIIRDIPIPRTEYVDAESEFVLENLDISSLSVLPGHVYLRNITDIDVVAPGGSQPNITSIGTLTHIRLQALRLKLEDVSFYYKDKTASVISEITGLLAFELPEKGVDVDIKLRLIPNTPAGLKQREQKSGYHTIDSVSVTISENTNFSVKQSNHSILLTMFKPVVNMRMRSVLEKTLAAQIQSGLEAADHLAWDVGRRQEVFADTGLNAGAAFSAAVWSEIGKLRRQTDGSVGLFTGWSSTGTGIIKDAGEGAQIAMGAEPQLLSGEKRGPLGVASQPLKDRLPDVDIDGLKADGSGAIQKAQQVGQNTLKKARNFADSIHQKAEIEKRSGDWKSSAFDV